jgi:hypothetical protein
MRCTAALLSRTYVFAAFDGRWPGVAKWQVGTWSLFRAVLRYPEGCVIGEKCLAATFATTNVLMLVSSR